MSALGTVVVRRVVAAAAVLIVFTGCKRQPQEFGSAEEAAVALVIAAEKFDIPALKTILGTDGASLVASRDTVRDGTAARAFAAEARMQHRIEYDSAKTSAVLLVGETQWPLPMTIVNNNGKWHFDAESGRDEILLRRIGRNELDAIDVARGYVEAQRMYALDKHDSAMVNQYAQKVISSPGKQDGLAWQTSNGEWQGPVGPSVARLIAEGYKDKYEPYHGYYFKILKKQGPAAPLGEMNFMVDGAMIGGFALVAAPAEYLVTGVKTFIVSHDGIVYEKDLGAKTFELFRSMETYNPDSTWKPVIEN